jgi:hypothetical protein
MSPTDSYPTDLVTPPSGIAGGAAPGESAQLTLTTLGGDGLSEGALEVLAQLLDSPDSGSSSSTSSASSLLALRNDSGEAVLRLTERATAYLRGLQGLPFRTVDEVPLSPDQGKGLCDVAETSGASCE